MSPVANDPNEGADPPTQVYKLRFQRGVSEDAMANLVVLSFNKDPTALTLGELRTGLKDQMKDSDCFLSTESYPVAKKDENNFKADDVIQTVDLKPKPKPKPDGESDGKEDVSKPKPEGEADDRSSAEVSPSNPVQCIRILVDKEDEKKSLKLQEWPKEKTFWESDVINKDIILPKVPKKDIQAPSNNAKFIEKREEWEKLGFDEWTAIFKNNNLLNGIRMLSTGPEPSAYPLVTSPPDIESFHTYRSPTADIDVTTVYSERDSRYISQGWTTGALSVETPYVSVAVEGGEQHMRARHKVGKTIFTTAKYKYGFVTLVMEPSSMTATAKFQTAIKDAMGSKDQSSELKKVFDRYGHTFPTEVTLGGLLETTESTKTTAEETEETHEWNVKAKIKAASTAGTYSAEAGVAHGERTQMKQRDVNVQSQTNITAKGGNPLLTSAIPRWITSLANYRSWRVIDISRAASVTKFIENEDTRKAVEEITAASKGGPTTKPLIGRWVEPIEYMSNDGSTHRSWFRTYRPFTTGDDGWFWLGPSYNYRWALIVKESGVMDGKGNALCEIAGTSMIWSNTMAKKDTIDLSMWRLHPKDPEYVALANHFQSGPEKGGSFKEPILTSSALKTVRAVRNDLLVKASVDTNPYFQNISSGSNSQYNGSDLLSVHCVIPPSSGAPNLYFFKGFKGSVDSGSTVWTIREDAIEILPS